MNRPLLKAFLVIGVAMLFCFMQPAYSQKTVLDSSKISYAIEYPLFLIDGDSNNQFRRSAYPTLSFGAVTESVWIKLPIVNQSKKTDWYIQIGSPPVLQQVEVYKKEADRMVRIYSNQANQSKSSTDVKVNKLLIPISIPINTEEVYYIKARSNNILRLPLKIVSLQSAFEQSYSTDILNGITFGILMAFAIYNLFVFILTKEQPYIYYLGYIFFWGFNVFFYNGFIPDIFPSLIWVNSAGLIIAMASIFSICFTNSFLQTKKHSPFFFKIRWLMIFLSFVILVSDILWDGAYSFIIIQYCMYPFFAYWFGAGIMSLKNGYKPALYFILGFGFLMLGNAVYNLKDLDILPDNKITQSSMHWGAILDALILSFALASRLNYYRKEKELIQLKSIEEKKSFLKELLQRQEHEKKRVAMELHDNIGQQLILIKNRSWRLHQVSEERLKERVMGSITHVAEIMAEVRSILHHLRPYQMDLLGLTQSIHGLVAEVFTDYKITEEKTENINQLFTTDESMHIFRILQLLTDDILASEPTEQINYAIERLPLSVNFVFRIERPQKLVGHFPNIHNRLELLNGSISVQTNLNTSCITVDIPYSS